MSAIKNLFRNGGGESLDRHLDHGYGVMIVTCLVETDSHSKTAVQQASKLGFRMRKTISDKSLTASCVARDIVEGNINYIRYICDSISGSTSCNVTLSYGYGPTTSIMIRYDEASQAEDCFVGRLLLLVELPENDMTSVVPPQDSLYHQIQACSSFPPEVYISPSTKIWDASLLCSSAQQNESMGKTIHMNINTAGEIYSVESTQGNTVFANNPPTQETSVPSAPVEESTASPEKVSVPAPVTTKDTEATNVSSKRKVGEKANVRESSKKPRVAAPPAAAAKKPTAAANQSDTSTPKKSKRTAAGSKNTPVAAHAKMNGETSTKSPRKQRDSKPAEPVQVEEAETPKDSDEEDAVVEKPPKKATTKSKKSNKNDAKGKDVKNQKEGESSKDNNKGQTEEETHEKEKEPTKKTTTKAKAAKKKDSKGPKRSLSAYMLFCQDHRKDIVKRNPDKTFVEIAMMLGNRYKELAPKEKARYKARANELRVQYKIDKKEYDDAHAAEEEGAEEEDNKDEDTKDEDTKEDKNQNEVQSPKTNKKKKKKAKKDPNAPKGAMSGYMFFCAAKRGELLKSKPGMSVPETGKVLGQMWRDLPAKEKEKFNKLAAKDKARYEDEMKAYQPVENI